MIHPVVCNPVLSPMVGILNPPRWRAGRNAPFDSILHWDADIDAFSEQTGGPHTFNHAVLSPQYQRNADGSTTSVGAKPAVDVFDGKKWLRSCGAITNMLSSGAEVIGGPQWFVGAGSSVGTSVDGWYPITTLATTSRTISCAYTGPTSGTIYFGMRIRAKVDTTLSIRKSTDSGETQTVNLAAGEEKVVGLFAPYSVAAAALSFFDSSGQLGNTFDVRDPFIVNLAYPVPYVPPGVTQPASNATTTNGSWFALPDGSPLWQALTGQPLTLATRVRMGVGSGDLPENSGSLKIVSQGNVQTGLQYYQTFTGAPYPVSSSDGVQFPGIWNIPWPRNSIIRRVTQVNTAGTQFRVGYMIEGTNTTIQWGSWVNYDSSFNPSTLYRLMLGYNNAYPMWFSRITAWKEQVSDARILEALNG